MLQLFIEVLKLDFVNFSVVLLFFDFLPGVLGEGSEEIPTPVCLKPKETSDMRVSFCIREPPTSSDAQGLSKRLSG